MKDRLAKLQGLLPDIGCDSLLIDDTINLNYFTGLHLSAGKLIVTANTALLGVDGRYIQDAKEKNPCATTLYTPEKSICSLLPDTVRTLGFLIDQTTYQTYLDLQKQCGKHSITLIPTENPIKKLRAIKSPEELHKLEQAAALGSEGYDFVVSLLKEGISEAELAFELEFFWKRKGGENLAFEPIIAFGPNSSKPHYRAGITMLAKGDTILIDIGVVLHGYHSDMTRVVFYGEPPAQMREIYAIVQQAQAAALALCRPGTTLGELDDAARNLIKGHGYGDAFSHSLGHGVGLEIHEYPTIKRSPEMADIQLEPGMVITIEPGIYLPGLGGVRIEDTVAITKNGYHNLTNRPTDLILIKA